MAGGTTVTFFIYFSLIAEGVISYATFGIPLLFLTPFLWLFLTLTFIAVQNLFDATDRDFFGRKQA